MKLTHFLSRLARRAPAPQPSREWLSNLSPREWADLPTHHPRRDSDAQ
jgi:hypothetical protein